MSNSIISNSLRGILQPTARRPQPSLPAHPATTTQSAFTLQHNDTFAPQFAGRRRRDESPESYADRLSAETHQAKWKAAEEALIDRNYEDLGQFAEALFEGKPGKLAFVSNLAPFKSDITGSVFETRAGVAIVKRLYNTAEGDSKYSNIKKELTAWAQRVNEQHVARLILELSVDDAVSNGGLMG